MKILDASERSAFALSKTMRESKKSYLWTKKTHATMLDKQIIPLYLEHLLFLIRRSGWKVTKKYSHYTFVQQRFKKDFILMNQRSRQQAKIQQKKIFLSFSIKQILVTTVEITQITVNVSQYAARSLAFLTLDSIQLYLTSQFLNF